MIAWTEQQEMIRGMIRDFVEQEIVPQITGLDIPWAKYIVLAVVLALVGLIIYERARKIDEDGS